MYLNDLLKSRRDEILDIAARHGAHNVRVFGSVARGEADSQSDVDLLVEFKRGTTLLGHAALMTEPVEIVCPLGIREIMSYAIDAQQAIKILQSMRCGDTIAEMSLSWPLVPGADEPIWHIRTTIGNYVSIGANTGNVLVGCQTA